ncbi:protein FAM135A-like [Ornithodoros turicata]|uniref:protein FAM135A-like n=1 Tax=Ornithodoros turicata TaxID=34597 RepID=UPI00313A132C
MRNEAVIDFAVELYTLFNFYLDTDGIYQVRTSLQAFSKNYSQVFLGPSKMRDGVSVSKCFPITARCDTLQTDINEIVRFEVHTYPRDEVRVQLQGTYYELKVALYVSKIENGVQSHPELYELVAERVLTLSFDPTVGLHHYLPVVFEVGNLSVLTIAIHASLVMICIPDIEKLNSSFLKQVVGQVCLCDYQNSCCCRNKPEKNITAELATLLTRAATQLKRRLDNFREAVFGNVTIYATEDLTDMSSVKARDRLSRFATLDREDTIQFADEETRKMCVFLVVLWDQYLEIALGRAEVRNALYMPLQLKRLARMAEAYLIVNKDPKTIYYDPQVSPDYYKKIAQQMRKSEYLRALPGLEVECTEVDGNYKNIPIIFEERYRYPTKKVATDEARSTSDISESEPDSATKFTMNLSRGSMELLALTAHPDTEVCNCRRNERFVNILPSCHVSKLSLSTSSSSRYSSLSSTPANVLQQKKFVALKQDFLNNIQLPLIWETPDMEELQKSLFSSQKSSSPDSLHLIIMVHGLYGSSTDLRLFRAFMEMAHPGANTRFLMARSNEREGTFKDFDTLGRRLALEILDHIRKHTKKPNRISFIGFSMGNVIIRSALTMPELKPLIRNLHTFLSIGGPHLGNAYNPSRLINFGMWYLNRLDNTDSLKQMALKDKPDIKETYLYRLSLDKGLKRFKNILLVGTADDYVVPIHSAHVKLPKAALQDNSPLGAAYREMARNIIRPLLQKRGPNIIRYEIHVPFKGTMLTTNVHIAPLDREVLVQKMVMVACARHFV